MIRGIQSNTTDYNMSCAPKYVPIAPSNRKHLSLDLSGADVGEKRYNYKSNSYSGAQAASIARRNARERNRVKQVNDGFNALRKRLPAAIVNALSGGARRGSGKKLSKVDTLRMVVEYIKHLQTILEESDAALGIVKTVKMDTEMDTTPYEDEGIFGGRNSPYSESVPSPANSDCSSGVSSSYSAHNDHYGYNYQTSEEMVSPVNDNELLDAISWWQQK
ncbi:achaete-scute complex protein T3-like [Epargyreus clarus]|uniref:achaete-scute complex protein T3-like n=1 Tax=Epargyreus clarus TaxID=520877 RepID=UPI003C2FEB1E